MDKAKQLGYTYVTNKADMQKAKDGKLLGIFANEEMFQQKPEGEGDIYNPVVSLPEMTKKAIDTLATNKRDFSLWWKKKALTNLHTKTTLK